LGQIQIQIAYIRVWGALFRAAGWEGEGRRSEGLTWRTLLAGEGSDEDLATGPTKTWRRAALLAQPSSRGKKVTSPQERWEERWGAPNGRREGENRRRHRYNYKINQPN